MSGGYTDETMQALRELEISVLWFGDTDHKWHVSNAEKVMHINESLPDHFPDGLLSSPVDMQVAMNTKDHETILAYVYVFNMRDMILSFATENCTNKNDKQLLTISHDLTSINLSKLEARLLEVRNDVKVPLLWRN